MHKLDRPHPGPSCLANYCYPDQTWDDMTTSDKANIRNSLAEMQAHPLTGLHLCAYCESPVYERGHIEHFRRKNPAVGFPALMFAWENLFLSCDSPDHCGHFKDRRAAGAYDPNGLVKPDEMDPDLYLYFHSSGVVRTRDGLMAADTSRADATIKVFGLNDRALEGSRAAALKAYRQITEEYLSEIESWEDSDKYEYLQSEINETANDPYSTTIRHYLLRY